MIFLREIAHNTKTHRNQWGTEAHTDPVEQCPVCDDLAKVIANTVSWESSDSGDDYTAILADGERIGISGYCIRVEPTDSVKDLDEERRKTSGGD